MNSRKLGLALALITTLMATSFAYAAPAPFPKPAPPPPETITLQCKNKDGETASLILDNTGLGVFGYRYTYFFNDRGVMVPEEVNLVGTVTTGTAWEGSYTITNLSTNQVEEPSYISGNIYISYDPMVVVVTGVVGGTMFCEP